jgi:molybdopterin molybdotransferase
LITHEQALDLIREHVKILGSEQVDIKESLNRVLQQDVVSDIDMPPFDKSAMDGYACRFADLKSELEVVEVLPAGTIPQKVIGENQCSKIMTGSMMPEGADCVIIVEQVKEVSHGKVRFLGDKTPANICVKGEDVRAGQQLLTTGIRITPKEIASLASVGCVLPVVSRRPTVGIIATGDEIIEPYGSPKAAQIRNSNSYQLLAQVEQFGCQAKYYGIVPDADEAIESIIAVAKGECDLILFTGGVSMGDFDLVPAMLRKGGFTLIFEKIAIQPGRPTVFGVSDTTIVLGLPGNPVSSYIVFEYYAKEILAGMMGLRYQASTVSCRLAHPYKRKHGTRLARVPVKFTVDGRVAVVDYHGSAHITALLAADGVITIPIGVLVIPEDTLVDVRPI